MSPIYLAIHNAPRADFVSRTAYGVELTAGPEAIAASVGMAARTLLAPPADSLSRFTYDAARPLDARFITCPEAHGRAFPLTYLEEEVQ